MSYGKPDQYQGVRKFIKFSFVISGLAVQIRPWAPLPLLRHGSQSAFLICYNGHDTRISGSVIALRVRL